MKTLDEVISGFECCYINTDCENDCDGERCPYMDGEKSCEIRLREDTIDYLKEYKHTRQKLLDDMKILEFKAEIFTNAMKDIENNPPLTWEELRQMVGKPIWIEYDNRGIEILSEPKQWVIISLIDNTSVMPEISLVGKWKTFWMQKEFMGKHWDAYKKEKNN